MCAELLQVVEGETPLLLPEVSWTAEELREHGEEEREERWKWEGHEEEKWAEVQRLCRRCHIVTSQLRRQAAALTGRSSLQVRSGRQENTTALHYIMVLYCIISKNISLYGIVLTCKRLKVLSVYCPQWNLSGITANYNSSVRPLTGSGEKLSGDPCRTHLDSPGLT